MFSDMTKEFVIMGIEFVNMGCYVKIISISLPQYLYNNVNILI